MKLCFDLETDGVTHSKVWCLAIVDIDTGEEFLFSDHSSKYPNVIQGLDMMDQATVLVGHHILRV